MESKLQSCPQPVEQSTLLVASTKPRCPHLSSFTSQGHKPRRKGRMYYNTRMKSTPYRNIKICGATMVKVWMKTSIGLLTDSPDTPCTSLLSSNKCCHIEHYDVWTMATANMAVSKTVKKLIGNYRRKEMSLKVQVSPVSPAKGEEPHTNSARGMASTS